MKVEAQRATTKGLADWFTGDVYVDPIAQNQGPSPMMLGAVHFTPCAHTAWHRHTLGQTLCVTNGEGFVQARANSSSGSVPAMSSSPRRASGTGTAQHLPRS